MPILVNCNFSHQPPPVTSLPRFDFRNADWHCFRDTVETLLPDSLPLEDIPQLEEAVTLITEVIQIAQEIAVPKTKPSHKPYSLSDETLSKIKERRKLRRAFFRNKDPILKPLINKLNHEIKADIKTESGQYWSNFCQQLNEEEDPANFWKLFKRVGNPRNSNNRPLQYDGGTHCSDESKASIFASTLLEAMTEPPSSLGPDPPEACLDLENKILNFSLSDISSQPEHLSPAQRALIFDVTLEEIEAAVKVTPNKAPGPDNIFVNSIKNLPARALHSLFLIYNACLRLGHVPLAWKSAIITMIPKPGKDLSDPSSFRPISLLSSLQKLFERIIATRLNDYLETYNLLSPSQSGFRKNLCTSDQLVRLHHDALQAVHSRRHLLALFFDVTKAFDKVWHAGLVYKLSSNFNIPLLLLKWISSYLTNRSFRVRVGNSLSEAQSPTAGVPQGSVIAPLLFILYVNDLSSSIPSKLNIRTSQYADDTALWLSGMEDSALERRAQTALNALSIYCRDWRISMNPSKSSLLLFARNRKPYAVNVRMDGVPIPRARYTRFLGLNFDSHLRWNHHVKAIRTKGIRKLNCLKILAGVNKCEPQVILKLYVTYLRPVLTYAFAAWANCPEAVLNKLELIERAAIRYAFRLPTYFSNSYIYRISGLTPLSKHASQLAHNYYNDSKRPGDILEIPKKLNKKFTIGRFKHTKTYPYYKLMERLGRSTNPTSIPP
jgi:hypothetical protein